MSSICSDLGIDCQGTRFQHNCPNYTANCRFIMITIFLVWSVITPTLQSHVDEQSFGSIVATGRPFNQSTCNVVDFGAIPGNRSSDAIANAHAIQRALDTCDVVSVPLGVFKITPITIPSNTQLWLQSGAVLVGSDIWTDYSLVHFMPPFGNSGTQPGMVQMRPLISAFAASNISIRGENGTIDGNGWYAWPSTNWSSPECGLRKHCTGATTFGPQSAKPSHVITFTHCSNVTMYNITVRNPAYWGMQHFFCNNTFISHVTILAPRWTREIAGFMPFSVRNYVVEDSFVYVGDDAVAIMSGPDYVDPMCAFNASIKCAVSRVSQTTMGVIFRRLFVRGRSVAIGSEDFGNVTDVLFEDCTIGDDDGSCPWAFKIKMHANTDCRVGDIVIRDTKFGRISNNTWQDPGNDGGVAIYMAMSYHDAPVNPDLGQPRLSNISFVNVTATATRMAGSIVGALHSIEGLHFRDCAFHSSASKPWALTNVSVETCTAINTTPTFPTHVRQI
eukprot:m.17629 g.17629  ORF g.17629 m.17629 type:complete len:503 (+) comp11593_c0_seq1:75-1583(+)